MKNIHLIIKCFLIIFEYFFFLLNYCIEQATKFSLSISSMICFFTDHRFLITVGFLVPTISLALEVEY